MEVKQIYTAALLRLAQKWYAGELPEVSPDEAECGVCIDYLQDRMKQYEPCDDTVDHNTTKMIDDAYEDVLRSYVINHYVTTASHRRWVRLIYRLLSMAKVLECDEDLETATKIHDLSKYGPEEAVGYGVMFGKTGAFRVLEGTDKEQWEAALDSHLHSNDHHPQFFSGDMSKVALEESVIDMLACRMERQLAGQKSVSPQELMDIDSKFLGRYTTKDRENVKSLLVKWREGLQTFVKSSSSEDVLQSAIGRWETDSGRQIKAGN